MMGVQDHHSRDNEVGVCFSGVCFSGVCVCMCVCVCVCVSGVGVCLLDKVFVSVYAITLTEGQ